jgi:hypothetical protein
VHPLHARQEISQVVENVIIDHQVGQPNDINRKNFVHTTEGFYVTATNEASDFDLQVILPTRTHVAKRRR